MLSRFFAVFIAALIVPNTSRAQSDADRGAQGQEYELQLKSLEPVTVMLWQDWVFDPASPLYQRVKDFLDLKLEPCELLQHFSVIENKEGFLTADVKRGPFGHPMQVIVGTRDPRDENREPIAGFKSIWLGVQTKADFKLSSAESPTNFEVDRLKFSVDPAALQFVGFSWDGLAIASSRTPKWAIVYWYGILASDDKQAMDPQEIASIAGSHSLGVTSPGLSDDLLGANTLSFWHQDGSAYVRHLLSSRHPTHAAAPLRDCLQRWPKILTHGATSLDDPDNPTEKLQFTIRQPRE